MSGFVGNRYDYVNEQGLVVRDVPCHNCGQNLRGLAELAKCPRCSAPVGIATRGSYLQFAQPRWLQGFADGIWWIIWGVFASPLMSLLALLFFKHQPVMQQYLVLAGLVISARGAWLLTHPDPSGVGERTYFSARRVVRIVVLVTLLVAIAQFALVLRNPSVEAFVQLAGLRITSGLLLVFCEFCKLSYIQHMALRLPEPELSRRTAFLKWAMAVSVGFLFVATVMMASSVVAIKGHSASGDISARSAVSGSFTLLVLPTSIAVGIVILLVLDLLYRMAVCVRAQVPLAVENWRYATGSFNASDPQTDSKKVVAAEMLSKVADMRGGLGPSAAAITAAAAPKPGPEAEPDAGSPPQA